MKGWCAKITEGKTRLELMSGSNKQKDGFIINEDNNEETEEIPFI